MYNLSNSVFKVLSSFIFLHNVVAHFFKEFYHWLAVCGNEAQRLGYGFVVELSARTIPP